MSKTLTLKPRLSEQAYAMSQGKVYVFEVPGDANKHTVARAIAAQFEVDVATVNIANIAGKAKRTIRKGGRQVKGRTTDTRKAYVTLKTGQSLPIFAAIEEEEAKAEETQAKVDKAAVKQGKKQETPTAQPAHRGLHLPGRRSSRGGDK